MALDVKFLLGADDTEFHTALASLESATSEKAGRIGKILSGQVKGFHELGQGINRVAGAFSNILGGFGLVGIIQSAVGLVQSWGESAREAAEQAQREAEARKQIMELVQTARSTLISESGSLGPVGTKLAQLERETAQMVRQVEETGKLNAMREKAIQIERDLMKAGGDISGGGAVQGSAKSTGGAMQRAIFDLLGAPLKITSPELDKLNAQIAELENAELELQMIESQRAEIIREMANQAERQAEANLKAMLAEAAGNQQMADTIREEERHAREMDEILKLTADGRDEEAARRLSIEEDLHTARLNNIDAEEARRRAAAAEQERQAQRAKEREAEQAREQNFRNGIDEESLEVERLKLEGREKESRVLAEQLEHKKRIHDIEKRDGLTDADRQRWIDEENRNFDLRIKAAEAEKTREAERRSLTAGVGFGAAESVRQVLGSRIGDQARSAQDRAATAAEGSKKILQRIHDLLQRPNWVQAGPARFG